MFQFNLLENGFFSCQLQEGVANLYIVATVTASGHTASVTIVNRHTMIAEMTRDGQVIYQLSQYAEAQKEKEQAKPWTLTMEGILDFANTAELEAVRPLLDSQIEMNTAIAREGLSNVYGAQVGRTLLDCYPEDVRTRARAYAAAGSDARMGGCEKPVVINSGSGNQGITASVPVAVYAKELGKSEEELFFADYKEFHIAGHDLAVAQVTCTDSPHMLERKDQFLQVMRKIAAEKEFSMVILMLTDVLLEGTQLIYVGNDEIIQQAFNVKPKGGTVFLPKVMSRKKQVIPMLSALWG